MRMKVVEIISDQSTVCLSNEELLIINSALNEICNGIEVFEFETRIGASRQRVLALFMQVGVLLDQIESNDR
jgi:hypothetical protein